MSYNLLSGTVNFEGSTQGTIEDMVNTHSTQTINGQKTFSNLSSSSDVKVTGDVNVVGNVSASINISASAFYSNGVLVDPSGGGISFDGSTANGVLTFKDSDEATVESNLTFDGSVLDFKNSSISGSGNISGSQFYGTWAGSTIDANKIEVADDSGIVITADGLAIDATAAQSQTTPNGNVTLLVDDSGTLKKSTLTQLLTNQSITDATALGNAGRVLLDGGIGTISSDAKLTFNGTVLSITGQASASSNVDVGGTLDVAGNSVFLGDVEIGGTLSGGSPLNISGAVNFISSSFNSSGSWIHTGSFFQSGSGNTFSIMDVVGIGTTSPTAKLEILSPTATQLKLSNHTGSAAEFVVAANGDLTITPSGSATFDSNLTINGNSTLGNASGDITTINGTAVTIPNGLNFNSNHLVLDHTNNRIGIGGAGPIHTLSVSGSFQASGSGVTTKFNDSRLTVSASTVVGGGGGTLFEINSPSNPYILAATEGGVLASNHIPAAFDANLYISGAAVLGAPATPIHNDNLHSGSVTFYLDEGNNKLFFKVRDSIGQVKSGSVSLT